MVSGSQPELSVIVPVYNVEDYLEECLESLKGQSFTNIEVVCVNDGSTDSSYSILKRYAHNDSRFIIVDKPNGGLSSARNAGISASSAPIICFLDSDDLFEPEACKRITSSFTASDPDVLVFGATCFPEQNETPWLRSVLSPRNAVYEKFDPKLPFKEASVPFAWRVAVKRDFLKSRNIEFDENLRYGEDMPFLLNLYANARKTVLTEDKIYHYRLSRSGSLMDQIANDPIKRAAYHLPIVDQSFKHWKDSFGGKEYAIDIINWSIDFYLRELLDLKSTDRERYAKEYSCIYRKYWSEDLKTQLSPAKSSVLSWAIEGKPLGDFSAKLLRVRLYADTNGRKALLKRMLGI